MDKISADLRAVLEHWGVRTPLAVRMPETGTINTNWIVDAEEGQFVLRRYSHQDGSLVEQEHALVFWASDRGIPSVPPLSTKTGDTFWERDGRIFALFPFAPGDQVYRDTLREEDINAMGRFLGRLHSILADYPTEKVRKRSFRIDRDETLRGIDRLERLIRDKIAPEPSDEYALKKLRGRRKWIDQNRDSQVPDIEALQSQVIHGDYNETNLFFKNEEVVAIIDWSSDTAPRGWEILRTMHLVFGFKIEPCRRFLDAYRTTAPMEMVELDQCARCYSAIRSHSLWLFEGIYEEGNDRLRRFLGPGAFVPIEERWARLRNELSDGMPDLRKRLNKGDS